MSSDSVTVQSPGRAETRAERVACRLENRRRHAIANAHRGRTIAAIGPILYIGLSFALMAHAWSDPRHLLIGTGGDPDSYLWDLQWPAFAIPHGIDPFFTSYLIAPSGSNLAWGGSLGPGILLTPFVILFGPVIVYNLLATLSIAASAWFAEIAIRRFVPSRTGSIAGGLIFGFSPYMMGHAWGHLTITLAFLPPLVLLALHETLVRQQWKWWITGTLVGALFAFQLVTFIETCVIVAIASAVVVVTVAVQRFRQVRVKLPYIFKVAGGTVASFFVVAAYPLWTLLFGAQRLERGTVEPPTSFVIDLVNFVVPTVTTKFVPSFLSATSVRITNGVESGGYIGVPLLLVCVITVIVLRRQIVVRTAAITGLVLGALALGPQLHVDGHAFVGVPMPFEWLLHLPLVRNILAARFMGVVDLCVAILVAEFVALLSKSRSALKWLGSALLGVGFIAIVPAPLPLPSQNYSIPSYFTSRAIRRIPWGSTVLVAPFDTSGAEIYPQLWQAASGFRFKMPEGYVYVPTPGGTITGPVQTPLSDAMIQIEASSPATPPPILTMSQRSGYLTQLQSWGVTSVIVGPMANESTMVSFFAGLFHRSGVSEGGVVAWYAIKR